MEKKCINCMYTINIQKEPGGYKSFKTKREHLQGYCIMHKQIICDYHLYNLSCNHFKLKNKKGGGENE